MHSPSFYQRDYILRLLIDIQTTLDLILESDLHSYEDEVHLEVMAYEAQLEDRLYQLSKESYLFFMRLSNKK